jgi:pimeloyl-ACP methyl ester carboxylesterase
MLGHEIARIAHEHQATRIVGVSFGSMVALQVALDHQDAIHHLVLAAPTIAGAETEPAARDRYMELMQLYRVRGPGPDMAELWMRSPPDIFAGTEAHPAVRAQIHDVVVRHRWRELSSGAMRGMTDHAQPPASLRQIRAALLVLVGENDMPTFLANAHLLGEHVAGCDVYQVPGAGHLCPLELPGSVAPRIDAHLRTR